MKHTAEGADTDREELMAARDKMSAVGKSMDTALAEEEAFAELGELEERFKSKVTLMQRGRRLVKEGPMIQAWVKGQVRALPPSLLCALSSAVASSLPLYPPTHTQLAPPQVQSNSDLSPANYAMLFSDTLILSVQQRPVPP